MSTTKTFLGQELQKVQEAKEGYVQAMVQLALAKDEEEVHEAVREWHASYLHFSQVVREHGFTSTFHEQGMRAWDAANVMLADAKNLCRVSSRPN